MRLEEISSRKAPEKGGAVNTNGKDSKKTLRAVGVQRSDSRHRTAQNSRKNRALGKYRTDGRRAVWAKSQKRLRKSKIYLLKSMV